jgi:DHA1 family multidrug resistance protein-like MFS transporter
MQKLEVNKALRILLITNASILLAGAMFAPISAIFVEKIGGNLLDASFAGGIFALAAGITIFISGKYADVVKENELIVVLGYVVMGIGFAILTIVNSVTVLFIAQIIIGIGEAIYTPAFDAIYSRHVTHEQSGRQWGLWEANRHFSLALGAFIGGYIANRFGFHTLFIFMAVLCFVSAMYIFLLPRKVL